LSKLTRASGGIGRPACAGRRVGLKMCYLYVLKSLEHDWFYVGITENVEERLRRHNNGQTFSTRRFKPFELVYKGNFGTRGLARDKEKFYKIRSNKEKLLRSLGYIN